MANKNNNGIRTFRCWSMADARQAVVAHRQAEQVRRRKELRAALQAHTRNYQRLRTGERRAETEPPDTAQADERKSRPTPVD